MISDFGHICNSLRQNNNGRRAKQNIKKSRPFWFTFRPQMFINYYYYYYAPNTCNWRYSTETYTQSHIVTHTSKGQQNPSSHILSSFPFHFVFSLREKDIISFVVFVCIVFYAYTTSTWQKYFTKQKICARHSCSQHSFSRVLKSNAELFHSNRRRTSNIVLFLPFVLILSFYTNLYDFLYATLAYSFHP